MTAIAENARWRAVVHYRSDNGTVDVEHFLAELEDLQLIVERGPHWDTVERIEIFRVNHNTSQSLTVEEAKCQ